jgi:hypothetical protein
MKQKYRLLSLIGCCLLLLFTACQQSSPPASHPAGSGSSTLPSNCPATGMARPAILPNMAPGTRPVYVYVYNNNDSHEPAHHMATLFRYENTSGNKTEIATFRESNLSQARLSTDRQWILFLRELNSYQQELQVERLDGKELQTLYCVPKDTVMGFIAWSPDQKMVAFSEVTQQQNGYLRTLKLLQLATGKLEVVGERQKMEDPGKSSAPLPEMWLDNTHLYVSGAPGGEEGYPTDLSLLDLTKGPPQSVSVLPRLVRAHQPYFDVALSLDHRTLYTSQCVDQGESIPTVFEGPSRLALQPALGGPTKSILQTPMAVTRVRAISSTTLLFIVNRTLAPGDQNVKALAENGIWKINTDGTGLTSLWQARGQQEISFNGNRLSDTFAFSFQGQYVIQLSQENADQLLILRSLVDSRNQIIAQVSREETVDPVGWATI